nr:ribonuclease HII [Paracoccus sp. S-4012]
MKFERAALAEGALLVAGVDEVGRGPLAGPVTAAAVILPARGIPRGIDDSKKLTAPAREKLAARIMAVAEVSVAHASVEEIDALNIYWASHLAMRRAVAGLTRRPCVALIDGNRIPADLGCEGRAVVSGDALCLSIAAASIIAKVLRDRIMVDLAQQHPAYGWERNAGYGTAEHRAALERHGPTTHHRRGFRPVHNILCQEETATG